MTQKRIAPYGSWKSPITATAIASESFGLAQVAIDGDDLYWTETRPWEGGRSVIVRLSADGETSDVTPAGFNVRNRVHEYGGGAFTVHDGVVYFTNDSDQRVYAHKPDEAPIPLTPDDSRRYADLEVDQRHNRILCVCEDHSDPDAEPTNAVVAIGIDGGDIETLAEGNDFYSSPRVSPDGDRICWLAWDHPNMPWDETELWVADVDEDGSPTNARLVAGTTGSPSASRCGRRTGRCASSPTGRAGGTCTAGTVASPRRMSVRWRRSSRGRSGSSVALATGSRQPTRSSAPTRRRDSGASRDSTLVPVIWSRSISRSRTCRAGH